MKKPISILVFVLMLCITVKAQSPREYTTNNMFWSETVLNGKIKGKFKYQLDYQYRRQAFSSENNGNHSNIFENRYQQVLRPWVHYQMNPNVRFSLSPIGWWGTWSSPNNGVVKFNPEYRICPQITLIQKIGRIEFSQRYRFEFRFIGNSDTAKTTFDYVNNNSYIFSNSNQKGRFRYYIKAIIPINKKVVEKGTLYINALNEIFISVGKNTGNYNLLDQNRFFAGVGYKFTKNFRCEFGYLNQTIPKFINVTHTNIAQNNIAQLYIIFDDFTAFIKKKGKQTEIIK